MALHILVPFLVARFVYPLRWKSVWLVLLLAMVIDVDHLLAEPLYDPNRCGIGFHPLHSWPAITFYVLLTMVSLTRVLGLGLLIHIALDGIDCIWLGVE